MVSGTKRLKLSWHLSGSWREAVQVELARKSELRTLAAGGDGGGALRPLLFSAQPDWLLAPVCRCLKPLAVIPTHASKLLKLSHRADHANGATC